MKYHLYLLFSIAYFLSYDKLACRMQLLITPDTQHIVDQHLHETLYP